MDRCEEELDESDLREFDCLRIYVRAMEEYNDWFEFYHQGKPKEDQLLLESLDGSSYTAKVASDERARLHKEAVERWQGSLLLLSKDVVAALEALLRYPGGWCSVSESASGSPLRMRELDYLRRTCVVEATLLLHSVLHDTRQYEKAVQLADVLASEDADLYHLFSKEDMKEVLKKIRDSSLALVEQKKDAWGYDK